MVHSSAQIILQRGRKDIEVVISAYHVIVNNELKFRALCQQCQFCLHANQSTNRLTSRDGICRLHWPTRCVIAYQLGECLAICQFMAHLLLNSIYLIGYGADVHRIKKDTCKKK